LHANSRAPRYLHAGFDRGVVYLPIDNLVHEGLLEALREWDETVEPIYCDGCWYYPGDWVATYFPHLGPFVGLIDRRVRAHFASQDRAAFLNVPQEINSGEGRAK